MEIQKQYGIFENNPSISHMAAASAGETTACLVRVPTEVLKTKMQTNASGTQTLFKTVRLVLNENSGSYLSNVTGGMYRGFGITLLREIPFALIQFPIYEWTKVKWSQYQNHTVSPLQAAACGSFGGGIAAAFTTPLDVIKTRLMLGVDKNGVQYKGAADVLIRCLKEDGATAFLKGIEPRVMWISIGGFVFFGMYEGFRKVLLNVI